jgi:hypothetical protein
MIVSVARVEDPGYSYLKAGGSPPAYSAVKYSLFHASEGEYETSYRVD